MATISLPSFALLAAALLLASTQAQVSSDAVRKEALKYYYEGKFNMFVSRFTMRLSKFVVCCVLYVHFQQSSVALTGCTETRCKAHTQE